MIESRSLIFHYFCNCCYSCPVKYTTNRSGLCCVESSNVVCCTGPILGKKYQINQGKSACPEIVAIGWELGRGEWE